jgi:hypothetical protein
MAAMTRIVTYHYKPPRKRRRKPAEAVEIAQRIVTATPRKKRQPVWQDDGEPVSEEVRDLVRRMMLRPPG